MAVVSLARFRSRDTRELLASLALIAEHEGGSVLVAFRSPSGWERVAMTGIYKDDPAKAIKAAMQISIALAQEEGAPRGQS